MTKKNQLQQYRIHVTHPREITEWKDLKIDLYIKMTKKEFELMKMQQLQVNEQMMLTTWAWWAKTISYTHMIEHIITKSRKKTKEKIFVNHPDKADVAILTKYIEQMLEQTEFHILKAKTAEETLQKAQEEIDSRKK